MLVSRKASTTIADYNEFGSCETISRRHRDDQDSNQFFILHSNDQSNDESNKGIGEIKYSKILDSNKIQLTGVLNCFKTKTRLV